MIISMVSDLVSFRHDPADERRIFLRVRADEKERRLHVVSF